jgi:hypothetical protein
VNIVEMMASEAIVKGPSEWANDETVYEKDEILGERLYDNPEHSNPSSPYFDPTKAVKFKVADGIHTFKELEYYRKQITSNCEKAELIHGTLIELILRLRKPPYLGQLICEIQDDGTKKFKLGNGIQDYENLPYIQELTDIPYTFVVK